MFKGFERTNITCSGIDINVVYAGSGPPVLFLHGYPQSHVMWNKVVPTLAQHFTVITTDLRGYGDSSKPASDSEHVAYSKRASAIDQVAVMSHLGHAEFALVGHDRGARVAHRMALDFPEKVRRIALIDIIPTYVALEDGNLKNSIDFYHWFFLSQPSDLPERLIGGAPEYFMHYNMKKWGNGQLDYFGKEAMVEYERCFRDPNTIHSTCEDYRASLTIDYKHDLEDAQQQLACPVLVLWGKGLEQRYDVEKIWKQHTINFTGGLIDGRHFLPEEKPDEVTRALFFFLRT